eukprot:1736003-Alexandrium_andersonii.AAC.1
MPAGSGGDGKAVAGLDADARPLLATGPLVVAEAAVASSSESKMTCSGVQGFPKLTRAQTLASNQASTRT